MQNCYMITSICISLLYEFLKIPISVTVLCDLRFSINACVSV